VLLSLTLPLRPAAPPEKGRELTEEEKKEVARMKQFRDRKILAAEFEEAVKAAQRIVDYRAERQGEGHWEVVSARWDVQTWQRPAGECKELERAIRVTLEGFQLEQMRRYSPAEQKLREALAIWQKVLGEQHPVTATSYSKVAACLNSQGKHNEALPLHQKALAIRQKALGEQHPDTAKSYTNVAFCLGSQGKHTEALPLHQKALAILVKELGEQHPDTASIYNNLALCLNGQGKHAEALPLFQKALAIFFKVRGEQDPLTAQSYNNVAGCLYYQGKQAEALPLHQKALAILLKVVGEQHRDTATSYNNVASCLNDQGKHAEALPLFQKALAILLKVRGEQDPETAQSYNNVASCLYTQGKHAEALPLFQKALAILLKVWGEQHPETARSYLNVASCLSRQGKHAEALPLAQKALAIFIKVRGEQHPDTAQSYNNLASCLSRQGKDGEALPLFQEALAIWKKVLGEQHPDTAQCYNSVAGCLYSQGKHAEAAECWQKALLGHESGRLHASGSGFERSLFRAAYVSPRAALAVTLVRLGQPVQAWEHAESDLARGLLDDLLPAADSAADLQRLARLDRINQALLPLLTRQELNADESKQRDALKQERDGLLSEIAGTAARRSRQRLLPRDQIQKLIPTDAALVFWLDVLDQHVGCVLRREGPPAWVKLPGSGKDNAWIDEDDSLAGRAQAALAGGSSDSAARKRLLEQLHRQRIAPLEQHLKGVRLLVVVPSGRMARIPIEALTDRYTVCYAPSASLFARNREKHQPLQASSLLLLADPVFTRTAPALPPVPPHGLLISAVVPGGLAARIGLRPGDVLLEYDGKKLTRPDDLKAGEGEERIPIKLWREGKELAGRIPAGKLGVVFDKRPIGEALAEWRNQESRLLALSRGEKEWQALPGTRLEARSLAALVPQTSLLLGSEASEQKLDDLAATGKLKDFRILHLATHGAANDARPRDTALVLAQDKLPATLNDDVAAILSGKKPLDGRLTVGSIIEKWTLDADLVVLSACQTGLGKYTAGDGMLGFTQALLQKGARSVVLSRWKVDDSATALLMARFYQNLLGRREGLKEGMKRAEALQEAKSWLRNLSRAEAEQRLAALVDGVPRGERGSIKAALPTRRPDEPKGEDKPFAHPYFWAAFVLIGDPF
jgi:CHAT domain-containing protein/tetratricopeptide (TPR) repeat protein